MRSWTFKSDVDWSEEEIRSDLKVVYYGKSIRITDSNKSHSVYDLGLISAPVDGKIIVPHFQTYSFIGEIHQIDEETFRSIEGDSVLRTVNSKRTARAGRHLMTV